MAVTAISQKIYNIHSHCHGACIHALHGDFKLVRVGNIAKRIEMYQLFCRAPRNDIKKKGRIQKLAHFLDFAIPCFRRIFLSFLQMADGLAPTS
jgi:hypothetical protein